MKAAHRIRLSFRPFMRTGRVIAAVAAAAFLWFGQDHLHLRAADGIEDSRAEPAGGQRRASADDEELRFWLDNMVRFHRFDAAEIGAVTGLDAGALAGTLRRLGVDPEAPPADPRDGERLRVLPYPGGRHPRIGFLDGAAAPQRETKASIFAPWKDGGYVVMDLPEAIWSNLGLTYLAHTHVDTIWSAKGIALEPMEWNRGGNGRLDLVRELPNGIRFGTEIEPRADDVAMRIWLENGTTEPLSDLRVQMCVMLKGAPGFTAQTNDNKVFRQPFVACRSDDGQRWIITAWEHCQRAWGNAPCPCLHSDPKLPDCVPGKRTEARGWIAFHEGPDIDREIGRLAERWGIAVE